MKEENKILYNRLFKKNGISRKPIILKTIGAFLILLIFAFMFTGQLLAALITFISIFVVALLLSDKNTEKSLEKYEETVLYPVLQQEIIGITYAKNDGMKREQYELIGFETGNNYNVKEYITIPFKNDQIQISNIQIEKKVNKESDMLVFDGYVSEFNISKETLKEVKVLYNAFDLIKVENDIPLDNTKFDSKYDVLCEDTNYAVRLFTQDFMLKIMELHSKYKTVVDIIIRGNKAYMRSKREVGINDYLSYKYEDVERKLNSIYFIKEMAELIYNMIEELE